MDKGLEVMNKLVDKQLRIIDEAQEKASNFLAKEVGKMNSDGIELINHSRNKRTLNTFTFNLSSV